MYPKYVQVSLDAPDEWFDPKSGLWFRKEDGIITLKRGLDATNIVRYLRFNYLIDVTSLVEKKDPAVEALSEIVEKTPNQLLQNNPPVVEDTTVDTTPEVTEEVSDGKEVCPFCGGRFAPKGMTSHKRTCKKNPNNK